MNYQILPTTPENIEAEALIVLHTRQGMAGKSEEPSLQKHIDFYRKSVESRESHAEWFCTLESDCPAKCKHMLLHSVTFDPFGPGMEPVKTVAAACIDICRRYSISKVAVAMQGELGVQILTAAFEGIFLGDFSDQTYKSNPPKRKELEVTFLVDEDKIDRAKNLIDKQAPIIAAQNRARLLVNAPYNELRPLDLAAHAEQIAARSENVSCTIHRAAQLREKGYGLITAVGGGSEDEPCLIEMHYEPKETTIAPPAILIGKGVCFDSGGYSIKPRDKMPTMNADMAGAAAVLEAFAALVELDCARPLTLLVPAVVNSVDSKAIFPGAILKAKSGKTVWIENTDAEGRLVLADALGRATEILQEHRQKESWPASTDSDPSLTATIPVSSQNKSANNQPGLQLPGSPIGGMPGQLTGGTSQPTLLTLATLTGATATALGERIGGLFSHDQELRNRFLDCGMRTGDHVWPLPLWAEYQPTLFHHLADLSNMSSMRNGGGIHAANFLQHFVPPNVRWAHLDMSRPARSEGRNRYFRPGATGYGVRLLVEALMKA